VERLHKRTDPIEIDDKGDEILCDRTVDPGEGGNVVREAACAEALSDMRRRMAVRLQQAAFRGRQCEAEYCAGVRTWGSTDSTSLRRSFKTLSPAVRSHLRRCGPAPADRCGEF